jgi:dTMP kinase
LRRIQDWATGGLWPDFTILLDCEIEVASSRMKARAGTGDRIEQESRRFHERVRRGYLELAQAAPKRFIVVNANGPFQEVITNFRAAFADALTGHC